MFYNGDSQVWPPGVFMNNSKKRYAVILQVLFQSQDFFHLSVCPDKPSNQTPCTCQMCIKPYRPVFWNIHTRISF